MRRFRFVLLLAGLCIAVIAMVPSASAGIRDEPCPTIAGENTNVCPAGQVGVPYSVRFRAVEEPPCSPGDDTWTVSGGAPPGLTMSSEGTLSGVPTQAGSFTFFVEMHLPNYFGCNGSRDSSEKKFTIPIDSPVPRVIVSTASLPDARMGQVYSAQLAASGGSVSSWSLVGGALPEGLALSAAGAISGTPTTAGGFAFTVQANGPNNNDTKQLGIFVIAPLVLGGPAGTAPAAEPVPVNGKVNTPLTWAVKATGGKGDFVYTSTPLPAGLTLNADGTVMGTPTTAGLTLVTFTVRDTLGTTDTLRVRLTIQALLAFATGKLPPGGIVGSHYRWKVPVIGASKTRKFIMSGQFPPGLGLDEATGILSGVPLKKGSYRIKLWVVGDPGTVISKRFTVKFS